ncbi:MAG TPA: hypothetical protein VKE69_09880 [Planctomycetota bacterium]|nr:hypothetical protein [Planctomycetota bacterium]
MEALVLIEDPAVRDVLLTGLQNVPGIHAESPAGFPDVDRARRRAYDAIFLDHDPNRGGSVERLTRLREIAPKAEIVVLAESRASKALTAEGTKLRIAAFLDTPLDVREFFRLAVQLRKRVDGTPRASAPRT